MLSTMVSWMSQTHYNHRWTGATTTTYAQKWGFASKVMTHWDNVSLDFDMDEGTSCVISGR